MLFKTANFLTVLIFGLLISIHAFAAENSIDLAGKFYDEIKENFLSHGWVLVKNTETEKPIYKNYPEISCGSGIQAICSVGFEKNNASHAFVLEKYHGKWIIQGDY